MPRVAALIGTAKPSPTPATAVLIPTTLPRPSTSAPPELPGLSAASVWITSSITRRTGPSPTGRARAHRPARARQRAPQRGHRARRPRAGEPVGVADRHHELADPQARGVAEL